MRRWGMMSGSIENGKGNGTVKIPNNSIRNPFLSYVAEKRPPPNPKCLTCLNSDCSDERLDRLTMFIEGRRLFCCHIKSDQMGIIAIRGVKRENGTFLQNTKFCRILTLISVLTMTQGGLNESAITVLRFNSCYCLVNTYRLLCRALLLGTLASWLWI